MMRSAKHFLLLLSWLIIFLPASVLHAGVNDSLNQKQFFSAAQQREVRNYIRPCLYMNLYATGSRPMKSMNSIPSQMLTTRLGNYKFITSNIGFYCPLYTHTSIDKNDSSNLNTFHLLMTMNGLLDQPRFSGLDQQHKLYKIGMGLRAIYGFGSKFILFVDASPYVVGDKYDKQQTQQFKFASAAVFNWMINPSFSVRGGITKTFLFGNRNYLPMLGFRIGKLDSKFYFNIQFPRVISFNFQPTPKFSFSIYSKSYGGLYNISNGDSLYPFGDKIIQFGQTGLSNGVRFDFRPSPNFSFFVAGGFAVREHVWLYSHSFNQQNHARPIANFFDGQPAPSLFVNFGIACRFGSAKKSSGNYLMYDIMDLNNTMDPGDNNSGPGNGDIRKASKEEEMKKVQYKDVVDLIDDTDLY
jgi:hypothetical protein